MIKQDFHISNIIARHLSGEITPEENAQLEKWRNDMDLSMLINKMMELVIILE